MAAENVWISGVVSPKSVTEVADDMLKAEIDFALAVGHEWVVYPSFLPKEPYQITLWIDLATALKKARQTEFSREFKSDGVAL